MRQKDGFVLNMETAKKLADSFSVSTSVDCFVLNFESGPAPDCFPCAFCRALSELGIASSSCMDLHRHSAKQAERFGGRYIYFCPHGMAHFVSPIKVGGRSPAYLIGGPVLIMDAEDFLEGVPFASQLSEEAAARLLDTLSHFPKREPSALNHLSYLMFAVAAHLGDSSLELMLSLESATRERSVGDEVLDLKNSQAAAFPSDKESQLMQAVSEGDSVTARQKLNELLGYTLFRSGGDFGVMLSMAAELLFTISYAARSGGIAKEKLVSDNHYYFNQLDKSKTFEDIMCRLSEALTSYTAQVAEHSATQHKDVITRSIQYIKQHFREKLTLDEVASQIPLSSVYFSRIFKESMGITFNAYLNQLRIRHSAVLLTDSRMSILDISSNSGFEDQSYYTKVFKKFMGVSPAKFREKQLAVDVSREREGVGDAMRA